MQITPGELLAQINTPDDLKEFPKDKLVQICDELDSSSWIMCQFMAVILEQV